MKIGFIGLGKMGMQMTTRLLKDSHEVVAMDVTPAAVEQAKALGAVGASTRDELIRQFGTTTPVVWLMIPSPFVQAEIEAWLDLLPAGSVIVDGGNSDYRLTLQRAELAKAKSVHLVDVGTSGGILGIKDGFSMMVGGTDEAVRLVAPALDSLAQVNGWRHFGATGTGHYIKMVHNGIEYGVMEAYAEGYHLLKDGPIDSLDLAGIADVWQHGSIIDSKLNELVGEVLASNPELGGVEGKVAENGEAQWTLETAVAAGVEMPVVTAAVTVRHASQAGTIHFGTKLLAAVRNVFGGHPVNPQ